LNLLVAPSSLTELFGKGIAMAVEADFVRRIFAGLEHGDGAAFFEHVADDVDWTVMGTHPLAGHYKSRAEFTAATFAKLGKVLPGGAQLNVNDVFIAGDVAIVELHSKATAKMAFASTTIIAGCAISRTTRSSASAPISIRRWWPGCSRRIRFSSALAATAVHLAPRAGRGIGRLRRPF
jgi:ketosteroid isomerase-like protein